MLPPADIVFVEQIRPELTWRLRRSALYPASPLYEMEMAEDVHGLHFGAFYHDKLVGVVSLFQHGTQFQFRKFAVDPAMQQRGIGTQLLQHITQFSQQQGGRRLWCDARLTAIPFYDKHGFAVTGPIFYKNQLAYQVMEKNLG